MVWQVVFSVVMRNQRCREKPANSKVASYGEKKKNNKNPKHINAIYFFSGENILRYERETSRL